MKLLFALFVLLNLLSSCDNSVTVQKNINFLHDIVPFTPDSLVNVVIEIPAGSRQKWEVNKVTGQIEWEQVSPDSFRVINYLPYPANYGFVPQTLLAEPTGGDGDPVDVFVLGSSVNRTDVIKARIVGIIHMLDENESDSKLLAVNTEEPEFNVDSLQELNRNYPGVIDVIQLWLQHYKGVGKVEILSVDDEKNALHYLQTAINDYSEHK